MKRAAALLLIVCAAHAQDTRKSGSEFMSESTRAMQRDDTQNPAMLWVANGEALWKEHCASCHGDARRSMKGVAARYPAFDKASNRVLNLSQKVAHASAKIATDDLLALEAYVALQSRGMPVAPPSDAGTRAAAERGKVLFNTRIGQLNLSCAQCHDANWGRKLAGAPIPQGHANAYPIYRLEWQGMGNLQRRLRNCMSGVRAAVPPPDAQDLVDLEAWLALRAEGMKMESPGVRP